MSANTRRSVIIITASFLLAYLWSIAASYHGAQYNGYPLAVIGALIAFAINIVAFIPAYIFQTEKFYDLTGCITFLTVTISLVLLSGTDDPRALLLAAMVMLWTLRLGSFLFIRIMKDGSDSRFDEIKPDFLRFFGTWLLQALWAIFTAGAAFTAITNLNASPLGIWALIGGLVWLSGFVIEVVADQQKRQFKKAHPNRETFIKSGLWAYSRHPNYFGEITLWFGIAIIALPDLQSWQLMTLISPLFVAVLLTKVSGVNMLEEKADERWQDDPDYQTYKKNTPKLVPFLK